MPEMEKGHLHGIVDMGSNGIRFSITDMSPSTARIMPTIFQSRCGISLYDAQYSDGTKRAIPSAIIDRTISALASFQRTCANFGVPPRNTRIIATEATRLAINGTEFREAIKQATGWEVELLPKEEEGRIGALGVASSFDKVAGLVLDLGGGSVQISWAVVKAGVVETSAEGAVSLPYGAAAVQRLMREAAKRRDRRIVEAKVMEPVEALKKPSATKLDLRLPKETKDLETTMVEVWNAALQKLQPPLQTRTENGYNLYLSGGGFRGWGYLLMNAHPVQPYPIPIINGFESSGSSFDPAVLFSIGPGLEEIDKTIFGISNRRASQLPAVELIIKSLLRALGPVSTIRFAQGGVREGVLYATLPSEVRQQHPLVVATRPWAQGSPESQAFLVNLLKQAIPQKAHKAIPSFLQTDHCYLIALISLLGTHASIPKEVRASAALRCTTSGLLAGAHGLSHTDRAFLALALLYRWGGSLPPAESRFAQSLEQLVGGPISWWCRYLGLVASWIGDLYPTGALPAHDHPPDRAAESVFDDVPPLPLLEADIISIQTKSGSREHAVSLRSRRRDERESLRENGKRWMADLGKIGVPAKWAWGLDRSQRWGLLVQIGDQ